MRKFLPLMACLLAVAGMGQTKPYRYMPDPKLTPGMADPALTRDVICANGWSTKSVRHTSAALKREIYREYGYDPRTGKHPQIEIDHLLPLECGGADVKENLWAELADASVDGRQMGFHEKDRCENAVHKAICGGQISLQDAQDGFKKEWTVLYRRFVSPEFPKVKQ